MLRLFCKNRYGRKLISENGALKYYSFYAMRIWQARDPTPDLQGTKLCRLGGVTDPHKLSLTLNDDGVRE